LDVLLCVEKIKRVEFSLEDACVFEGVLQAKHPLNHNIRAKARSGQQLRFLRAQRFFPCG
jgi:hypothetical protein